MMKKAASLIAGSVAALALFAGTAGAHVTVWPKEANPGAYEKFTVRVPSEAEDTPTVKVEVRIPEEVNISRVEPKPGWTYTLTRDAEDKVTGIAWTAEGQGLLATEFAEFNVSGKIADDAEALIWEAHQYYGDVSVVAWAGPSDSDLPASVTTIVPSENAGGYDEREGSLSLTLSIVAVVLGALSLALSLRKGRPAKTS